MPLDFSQPSGNTQNVLQKKLMFLMYWFYFFCRFCSAIFKLNLFLNDNSLCLRFMLIRYLCTLFSFIFYRIYYACKYIYFPARGGSVGWTGLQVGRCKKFYKCTLLIGKNETKKGCADKSPLENRFGFFL